jgi:predicted DNA binding protein
MPLFEVVLKVTHDCPWANLSRRYPSMKMFFWCNEEHDFIEVTEVSREDRVPLAKELSQLEDIIEQSSDRDKLQYIVKKCHCKEHPGATDYMDTYDLLQIPPIVYSQGWEYYRIIAFQHEHIDALLGDYDKHRFQYEIVRKQPFKGFVSGSMTLTADALFADLTKKQIGAVLTAYANGYYQFPRRANVKLIAAKGRVPRTTFQEHLHKAEGKIVASLFPYLELYSHVTPGTSKAA